MPFAWQDLREASRALRRAPRFTLLCVAVLGVGIGLSAAMFTALDAVLLRRLPVIDQDRVVAAWGVNRARSFSHLPLNLSDWREFAAQTRTLEQISAVDYNPAWPYVVRDGDRTYPIVRGLVTGGFFRTLGAKPVIGRLLVPEDDRVGAEPVTVLSFAIWQRQFGGERSVLGHRLRMHGLGVTYTVVGVAPQGLDYPAGTEMWVPIIPASTFPPAESSRESASAIIQRKVGRSPGPEVCAVFIAGFLTTRLRAAGAPV